MLFVTSALPLRASHRAQPHAKHVQQQALKGCPVEGGEKLAVSEAMTMYEGSTSDESGSTCARAGENGLDRAALDVASAGLPPVPGATLMLAAPDAIKGGIDEEEAAQSYLGRASWCLFQVLASVVPRRSSSAMGAAWHSSVVGYLLIWGDVTPVAAETSVHGRSGRSDDNTKSKTMTKTNNPPRASAGGLAQRRALADYVVMQEYEGLDCISGQEGCSWTSVDGTYSACSSRVRRRGRDV